MKINNIARHSQSRRRISSYSQWRLFNVMISYLYWYCYLLLCCLPTVLAIKDYHIADSEPYCNSTACFQHGTSELRDVYFSLMYKYEFFAGFATVKHISGKKRSPSPKFSPKSFSTWPYYNTYWYYNTNIIFGFCSHGPLYRSYCDQVIANLLPSVPVNFLDLSIRDEVITKNWRYTLF